MTPRYPNGKGIFDIRILRIIGLRVIGNGIRSIFVHGLRLTVPRREVARMKAIWSFECLVSLISMADCCGKYFEGETIPARVFISQTPHAHCLERKNLSVVLLLVWHQ